MATALAIAHAVRVGGLSARTAKGAIGIAWLFPARLAGLGAAGSGCRALFSTRRRATSGAAFLGADLEKGILPEYLIDSIGRYPRRRHHRHHARPRAGPRDRTVSRFVDRLLAPTINFMFAIVEVAWIPIFVIWFGYGIQDDPDRAHLRRVFSRCCTTRWSACARCRPLSRECGALAAAETARQLIVEGHPAGGRCRTSSPASASAPASRSARWSSPRSSRRQSGIGYLIFSRVPQHQQTARTVVGMIVMGLMWLFIDNVYLKPFERATRSSAGGRVTSGGGAPNDRGACAGAGSACLPLVAALAAWWALPHLIDYPILHAAAAAAGLGQRARRRPTAPWLANVGASLGRLAIGFVIGNGIAIPLGIAIALNRNAPTPCGRCSPSCSRSPASRGCRWRSSGSASAWARWCS